MCDYLFRKLCGIDFSGAQDAGRKIWIASGVREGTLIRVTDCCRARELPGGATGLQQCLLALREFIAGRKESAFGLDFPFGLPRALVSQGSWREFVLAIPDIYSTAESFRHQCLDNAHGRELKRLTDKESATPFSPYNLRLFKQTYCGIAEILSPLVRSGSATVLPMQPRLLSKPCLLEICPASTLRRENLYKPYKGKESEHFGNRRHILKELERRGPMVVSGDVRRLAEQDIGGDAVDSIVALFAVFCATTPPDRPEYLIEGYVYV